MSLNEGRYDFNLRRFFNNFSASFYQKALDSFRHSKNAVNVQVMEISIIDSLPSLKLITILIVTPFRKPVCAFTSPVNNE